MSANIFTGMYIQLGLSRERKIGETEREIEGEKEERERPISLP